MQLFFYNGLIYLLYSEDGFSIFCSNARSAAAAKLLQEHQIKSVLNVSEQIRFRRVTEETQKILYYYLPLSDYGDTILSEVLEEVFMPIGIIFGLFSACSVVTHFLYRRGQRKQI